MAKVESDGNSEVAINGMDAPNLVECLNNPTEKIKAETISNSKDKKYKDTILEDVIIAKGFGMMPTANSNITDHTSDKEMLLLLNGEHSETNETCINKPTSVKNASFIPFVYEQSDAKTIAFSSNVCADKIKLDVSQYLHEIVNEVIEQIKQDTSNSEEKCRITTSLEVECTEVKTHDIKDKTSQFNESSTTTTTIRTSSRRRIPKKSLDEQQSIPVSFPVPVVPKEMAPVPETPVLYQLGDLVWAYVPGHPLWPCMLVNDPLESKCTKMQGTSRRGVGRSYHVQFLGDSPEHSWVRHTRIFPYTSPADYLDIIKDITNKSKRSNGIKIPRIDVPARLKDDWDSGIEEILEAAEFNNEERLEKYVYDFKPYMKEFKHLYSRRDKMLVYKECKRLLKEMLSNICEDVSTANFPPNQTSTGPLVDTSFPDNFGSSSRLKIDVKDCDLMQTSFGTSQQTSDAVKSIVEDESTSMSFTSSKEIVVSNFSSVLLPQEICDNKFNFADTNTPKTRFSLYTHLRDSESTSPVSRGSSVKDLSSSDSPDERCSVALNSPDCEPSSSGIPALPVIDLASPLDEGSACNNCETQAMPTTELKLESQNGSDELKRSCQTETAPRSDAIVSQKVLNVPVVTSSGSVDSTEQSDDKEYIEIDVKIVDQVAGSVLDQLDKCNCTALSCLRGSSRGEQYTTKNVILAVEGILNGRRIQSVSSEFGIPRSTLSDYIRLVKTLTVKHHSECDLFPPGVSALTYGFVTHVLTDKNYSWLQLVTGEEAHSSEKPSMPGSPVVMLDRNEVIVKPRKARKTGKFRNQPNKQKQSLQSVKKSPPNGDSALIVPRLQAEKAVSALQVEPIASESKKTQDRVEDVSSIQQSSQEVELSEASSGVNTVKGTTTSPKLMQDFGFSQEQLCIAWENCKKQKNQLKSKKSLTFDSLKSVAEGMDIEEAVRVNSLNADIFKTYIEKFLAEKTSVEKPSPFKSTVKSTKKRNLRKEKTSLSNLKLAKSTKSPSTTELRPRRYTFSQLLQALDDLCANQSNFSIGKTSTKYNIPYSTLKDCYIRNVSIVGKLVKEKSSRKDRLVTLLRNSDKLRLQFFKSKPEGKAVKKLATRTCSTKTSTAKKSKSLKNIETTLVEPPIGSQTCGLADEDQVLLPNDEQGSTTSSPSSTTELPPKPAPSTSELPAKPTPSATELPTKPTPSTTELPAKLTPSSTELPAKPTPSSTELPAKPTPSFTELSESTKIRPAAPRRDAYTTDQLQSALQEARKFGNVASTAVKFGIPATTLRDRLYGRRGSKKRASEEAFLKFVKDDGLWFTLKVLNSWGWPLSQKDVRQIVTEVLDSSPEWHFESCISDLFLLRLCQTLSITFEGVDSKPPDTKIDPFKMAAFTNKLLSLLDDHGLKKFPSQVYLLQEYINLSASDSRTKHTVLGAFNAAGEKYPPLVVFGGSSAWCSYENAYAGTQFALSSHAQITPLIIEEWINRFLAANYQRPLLLLYDGQLTMLPLSVVQKLYESNCVILKLPYPTINTSFQLPYKSTILNALNYTGQESICTNRSASGAEVVASINRFWTKSLTSKVIRDTFSSCRFLSIKEEQTLQLDKKLREKITTPVEFKPPSESRSSGTASSKSDVTQSNTDNPHPKTLKDNSKNLAEDKARSVTYVPKSEMEFCASSQSENIKNQHKIPSSNIEKESVVTAKEPVSKKGSAVAEKGPDVEKCRKRSRSGSLDKWMPHRDTSVESERRSSQRIRERNKLILPMDDSESDDDEKLKLDDLESTSDLSYSATTARSNKASNDVSFTSPSRSGKTSINTSMCNKISNDVTVSSPSLTQKTEPQRILPVAEPVEKPNTRNKAKETNASNSSSKGAKNKTAEPPESPVSDATDFPSVLDREAMFQSYFNKRSGPLQTERPNLTSDEIEDQVRKEWEFLSPRKRLKYGKRHPEDNEESPKKKKQRTKRPKQLKSTESPIQPTLFTCDDCDAKFATKPLLNQHSKTCSKNKEKAESDKEKPASNLTENSQFKCAFQCELCNDKFYSSKSLQIHKKFCTVKASNLKKGRIKQVLKESKVSLAVKRSKSITPMSKNDGVLNGTIKRKSLSISRRKKSENDINAEATGTSSPTKQSPIDVSSSQDESKPETDGKGLTPSRKSKGRGRPQLGGTAKRENICIVCEEVTEKPLLTCTGGCCQSVHLDCIEGEKPNAEEPYKCRNCVEQTHSCFICKIGPDKAGPDLGKIKRCSVQNCGHSYHTTCLHTWKLAMITGVEDNRIQDHYSFINNFRCPLHNCATCASRFANDPSPSNSAGSRMFRCMRCPTAFHAGDDCIAAGSVILPGLNILCPDHFEPLKTTPYHQPVHVSWCFMCSKGGELVCCEGCPAAYHPSCVDMEKLPEGEWYCRDCRSRRKPLYADIVWVKLGSYRWWPGEIIHPHDVPDNIRSLRHDVGEFVVNFFGSNDYFWLNKRRVFQYQEGDTGAATGHCSRGITSVFNKALRDASAKFEKLQSRRQQIDDVRSQKKRPHYKFVKTNRPVGNVQVYTADLSELPRCICKKTDPNPCGPESECLNRMLMFECHPSLCPAGLKCQNQHFQKRDYPQSEVFKTTWGGWGLKTSAFIKKGDFVNEYVGELVDNEECMRRIELAHKTNVTNFYMLTLDKYRIIDAGPKGNWSRFMNHSCDPSCETQKWTVNGDARVGLFARRDIKPGEELTFNYNLDCLGNDKTPCVCGSKNCSGFIGVRPKPQLENKTSDQKVKKKRKRGEARDLPKHDDFCFRCRQVGTLVCCDVRGCQRAFCLACLRLTKPPFGKWECPWHHCDFCGRRAQSFCHFCPNSFCASHVMNQLTLSVPNQYDCCTDHDPNVAEYDMEEAIAAVVASMLPAEQWEEEAEQSGQATTEEIKVDGSPSVETEKKSLEKNKKRRKPKEKEDGEKQEPKSKSKRSRPKKKVKDEAPSAVVKEEAPSTPNPEVAEEVKDLSETPANSSLDESLTVTESDIDLAPITSSPVRRKRSKQRYYRGSKKKKRAPSKAEKELFSVDDTKTAKAEPIKKTEVASSGSTIENSQVSLSEDSLKT